MPAPLNTLKSRLQAGETLVGLWLGLAHPYPAEIAATAGFDWLLIDGEHAPNDLPAISAQLAVLSLGTAAPVVRLVDGNPAGIKQALDIGAQTLLIPMVESAGQARALVAATRYPPKGIRGVGSSLARASGFGAIPDYLTTAEEQICLILQVESRKGLAALDDILAVEGVDGVFIGPSDLAADMGHPGDTTRPALRDAVTGALARIRQAGKIAGVLAVSDDFIALCRQAGANFLGVGIDVTVLAQGLRTLARRHTSAL